MKPVFILVLVVSILLAPEINLKGNNTSERINYKLEPEANKKSFVSSIKRLDHNKVEFVFTLGSAQIVRADVFDIHGSLMIRLLNKRYQIGEHKVVFDVSKNKALTTNGIYILKFSLEDKQNTYKLKVVK